MTYREARRKLGTRSIRRANTNGKNTGKTTAKSRALKRKYPRPVSRKNIIKVARLVAGLPPLDVKRKVQ